MDEMYRLKKTAEEVLRNDYMAHSPEMDCGDMAHEITDGMVPVYTADLLRLALDDLWLASTEPELGPAFDGTPAAVNFIAANVYEKLYEHVSNKCYEVKQ